MIEVKSLTRKYGDLTVLHDVSLKIERGEFVAVTGPSGSGKSTLMGLLAGLDRPTGGQVILDHEEITSLTEEDLSRVRGQKVGFVFQNFLLVQTLTALENVMLPAEIMGRADAKEKAEELLTRVGLAERMQHYPAQLSGGEMQRVAIARAFVNYPPILFADEPTGNLDSLNGDRIVELLLDLNQTYESTLVLITHNPELAGLSDREFRLRDGKVVEVVAHRRGLRGKASSPNGRSGRRGPVQKRRTRSGSGARK